MCRARFLGAWLVPAMRLTMLAALPPPHGCAHARLIRLIRMVYGYGYGWLIVNSQAAFARVDPNTIFKKILPTVLDTPRPRSSGLALGAWRRTAAVCP